MGVKSTLDTFVLWILHVLIFPQPYSTYQLDKISINKEAKKNFIDELPPEPKVQWAYKRRCGMLEKILQQVQNENTDEASKLLDTAIKVDLYTSCMYTSVKKD